MPVMNQPTLVSDVSEALSPSERAFRADLNQKLRAPLNAIIGFAELLAMRPGESATKNADVQHILQSARDVLRITRQARLALDDDDIKLARLSGDHQFESAVAVEQGRRALRAIPKFVDDLEAFALR